MLQVIGEIFKILWKIIVFAGKAVVWFFDSLISITDATSKLLGITMMKGIFLKALCTYAIAISYMAIFSLIPEIIMYYGCTLTKKYKSLKNDTERKNYRKKHTFAILRIILSLGKNESIPSKKSGKKCKQKNSNVLNDNEQKIESLIAESKNINEENKIVNTFAPKRTEEEYMYALYPWLPRMVSVEDLNKTDKKKNELKEINPDLPILFDEDVQEIDYELKSNNIPRISNEQELENELNDNNTKTSDIKILYTSNIIGNALRNGTVVKRRLLQTDKPFLVDFSQQPPKEIITENTCDGLSVQATIKGQKIEMALEDPNLLNNPVLFNEMTKEELKELKDQLESDMKYKSTLKSFFTMNKKALELKKH